MSTDTLGDPPEWNATTDEVRAFLTRGYGLPEGYDVDRVVRHGGRSGTGLTVYITPPGDGAPLRVSYEREADCTSYVKLRAQAASDTKGLTRGWRLNSQKAASAMYEALCTLADHFEAADLAAQTWEWMQELRRVAARTRGSTDSHPSLKRLQRHEYTKALVQDPPRDDKGNPQRPVLLLLVDEAGYEYITARHMAVFLRYHLGVSSDDAGTDDRILTRLTRIGGERIPVEKWDSTGRDRQDHIILVLYRLPEETP